MKPLTSDLYKKIQIRIKNKIDISDLIEGVDIKEADLSRAIIYKFKIIDGDISNCNFSHCLLGSEGNIFTIIRTKMLNCNFEGAKFVSTSWVRSCDAKGCNFKNADVSNADYQHTDFRNSTFCGAKITIGTTNGVGCRFPAQMFYDLTNGWLMKINVEE